MSEIEHGFVTSVQYEQGVPVCDVQLARVNTQDQHVPVSRMHHSMYLVPEEGQKVQMLKLGAQRFITGVMAKNDDAGTPSLDGGEVAFQFDSGTKLSFTKDGSGNYDVTIEASGDVNIDASGNVYIDGIDFDQHTHDFEDSTINDTSDGSGTESTETKTTNVPNGP